MTAKLSYTTRWFLSLLLAGVLAGVGAACLSLLLHHLELLAFGHVESETVLMTADTSKMQRFIAVMTGGVVVSIGWAFLQTKGSPIVSIKKQLSASPSAPLPAFFPHLSHSLLQIIGVGTGMPLGREVAPREVATLFAGRIAHYFSLTEEDRVLLLAASAAAGLAGVYQVPFAGSLFALEILLVGALTRKNVLAVLLVNTISTWVAGFAVDAGPYYQVAPLSSSSRSQVLVAVFVGLVTGLVAYLFKERAKLAQEKRSKGRSVLWTLPLSSLLTAMIAIYLPDILGNGRSIAQTAFWQTNLTMAVLLFLAKWLVVLVTLRSGGYGGTLTPSLSLGAMFGLILGLLCQLYYPQLDVTLASLAGAVAFLSISLQAPLTSLALVVALTGQDYAAYLPLGVAVISAYTVVYVVTYFLVPLRLNKHKH